MVTDDQATLYCINVDDGSTLCSTGLVACGKKSDDGS